MNLKDQYKDYYTAQVKPNIIEVKEAKYLSILGNGSPGTDVFYKKKREIKVFIDDLQQKFKNTNNEFSNDVVEIFYWFDENEVGYVDIGNFYTIVDLDLLHYRIAIRIPEFITDQQIKKIADHRQDLAFSNQLEIFEFTAGKCVQILHEGPFAGELETLPILQEFTTTNGLKKSGMHQEIHLINFEKGQNQAHLKTILRDAVTEI